MQNKMKELAEINKEIQDKNATLLTQLNKFQVEKQTIKSSNTELRKLLAMQNKKLEKLEKMVLANLESKNLLKKSVPENKVKSKNSSKKIDEKIKYFANRLIRKS